MQFLVAGRTQPDDVQWMVIVNMVGFRFALTSAYLTDAWSYQPSCPDGILYFAVCRMIIIRQVLPLCEPGVALLYSLGLVGPTVIVGHQSFGVALPIFPHALFVALFAVARMAIGTTFLAIIFRER